MGILGLAVVASAMFIAACASPASAPADATGTSRPQQERSTPALNGTFETTASRRDEARAAGLPVLLRGDALIYPADADRQTIGNGWVQLLITVNPDGTVATARVLDSSHPAFNDAATRAAHSWQFAPQAYGQSFIHRMFITAPDAGDHYQPAGVDR